MYQTFTGTSKRTRQINLSGRQSTNPFGALGKGPNVAVESAQQEREERARQRRRQQAAGRIQKVYRGHVSRTQIYKAWREDWDREEEQSCGHFADEDNALRQLRRLLLFYCGKGKDVTRLIWLGQKLLSVSDERGWVNGPWPQAYLNLLKGVLVALQSNPSHHSHAGSRSDGIEANQISGASQEVGELLSIAAFSARRARLSKTDAVSYYETLTNLPEPPTNTLQTALLAPLQRGSIAYTGLAVLLARPLQTHMLNVLRSTIDPTALFSVLHDLYPSNLSMRERLWLLGNTIFLGGANSTSFVTSVSTLLGSLAEEVDFESKALDLDNQAFDRDVLSEAPSSLRVPLNTYLAEQTKRLVEEDSVRALLVNSQGKDAQVMASFALTLLRCFPRQADEIRMWLYLGPARSAANVAATLYFWRPTKQSMVFATIERDSRAVLALLKPTSKTQADQQHGDWTIILLFLELYTFLLKLMDDEEFMGADMGGRRSQIPLEDVAGLVTFLKNLGFTLYFNAADLNDAGVVSSRHTGPASGHVGELASYERSVARYSSALQVPALAGIPGLTLDYLRGLTTGLLRAIYERDSRRAFLPKGHWLMTTRFDMSGFIDDVVVEEEKRHAIQVSEDEDDAAGFADDEEEQFPSQFTSGYANSHAGMLRSQVAREHEQRKASRRRRLESVAPRLEILQNLPFFIPFETRVEIFRQFVALDQEKRRNGVTDPDQWRAQMMALAAGSGMHPFGQGGTLARHTATVRRKQEFADAYSAFYSLGEGLKEPIQITFEDQWGNPEAGIDGGGVTKEFLTSVINQAFDQDPKVVEERFFVENESHLLYPNPTAIEDFRVYLTEEVSLKADSSTVREAIRDLFKKYEFLGRIIGKCLYEGILVDVNFAGFFLKKWALTGGNGSAPMESGYRANINDLKELDEGLYRNLLWLKNATPSEIDDLGVAFTVDDSVGRGSHKRVIERELIKGGAERVLDVSNRLYYINRVAWYRLQGQSAPQTNAFLKGLSAIVHPNWLSMFNQNELQTLISGSKASIDVEDLRANTLYGGTYVIGDDGMEHPTVQKFWRVMRNLEDEDRQRVLKFVTSTPRGPLLGFGHLNPRFSIRDSGQDENRLPSTSTCVNLLKLPMYKSERVLKEKLLHAVRSGAGFDLS